MTTTVVRFPLPDGATPDDARHAFKEVAPRFREIPGLLRKSFLLSEEKRTAGGVYLWESLEAAEAYCEGQLIEMIEGRFRVTPTIEYYETPLMVDNITGEIR